MEDLYGAHAYAAGWGAHHREDFVPKTGRVVVTKSDVDVEFVSPVHAVQQSMELRS